MGYQPIRTPDDLAARLQPGVTREDHWLEFKGLDTASGHPYAKTMNGTGECRRDVIQFANASGGSIVYGAVEQDHVFERYVSVPDPQELARWIDEVVKQHLEPVPVIEPHVIRAQGGKQIVVVNVPPSVRLVGLRPENAYEFLVRTADSRRNMTLMEVEARMQDQNRVHRLQLEQIAPTEKVMLDAMVDRELTHDEWRVLSVTDNVVTLRHMGKQTIDVVVPLAYVQAVYRAELPKAEWVVDLSCHLSKHLKKPLIVVTKAQPGGRNSGHYREREMDDA